LILPTSASQVARIIDMSHQRPAGFLLDIPKSKIVYFLKKMEENMIFS
jgi:hypothetical protein